VIVCLCRGVSDRTIRGLVASGVSEIAEITSACGAAGDCGACMPFVEKIARETEASVWGGLKACLSVGHPTSQEAHRATEPGAAPPPA
jgi:bacterioferritin-associated ferredoxin